MKTKTFARRLGSADSFPIELTLPGGVRHVALHPAYAYLSRQTGRLCLFSDRSDHDLEMDPGEVLRVRRLNRVERDLRARSARR